MAEMSFKSALSDKKETLDPPTEEEITILRAEMYVRGQFMDASPHWVTKEDERWIMVEKEVSHGRVFLF